MRWLINYFRSAFCKHDWEREEMFAKQMDEFGFETGFSSIMVSATCKKCGWHKSYWKF